MTNYAMLRRKPSLFRMFTGLSTGEFNTLVSDLEPVWFTRNTMRSTGRARRKAKLLFTDLLLTLLYYRA